jgi:uncharacterized UPF0146 family protein
VRSSCKGLVDYIVDRYKYGVEVGIGHFPDVALALMAAGVGVFATDIKPFLHQGLRVMVDDVTQPNRSLYADVDFVYALRPPPELVPYMKDLASEVGASLMVKPLASEYPGGQLVRRENTTFFLWSNL